MATTTDLNTLVINYLTQAQYEAEVSGGTVDPDALYLTPDAGGGGGGVSEPISLLVETKTTSSFNVSANTVLSATQSVDVSKTGYTPLGIVGIGASNNNLNILRADLSGNTGYIRAHNPTSSAINGVTVTLHVLYLKN